VAGRARPRAPGTSRLSGAERRLVAPALNAAARPNTPSVELELPSITSDFLIREENGLAQIARIFASCRSVDRRESRLAPLLQVPLLIPGNKTVACTGSGSLNLSARGLSPIRSTVDQINMMPTKNNSGRGGLNAAIQRWDQGR
jgi:hypothetical protein